MVLSVLLLGLAHARDVETVRRQRVLPDPHLALSLSLTLGFGAGRFYAERPTLGTAFSGLAGGQGRAGLPRLAGEPWDREYHAAHRHRRDCAGLGAGGAAGPGRVSGLLVP